MLWIIEWVCPRDNFLCANGECLEALKICDGNDDCGDKSDEGTICSGDAQATFIHITMENI